MAGSPTDKKFVKDKETSYLGDPWRDAGALAGFEPAIEQGPGLFLAAVGILIAVAAALFVLFWYSIAPRLEAVSPSLPVAVLFAGGVLVSYIFLEFLGIIATTYTGRALLLPLGRSNRVIIKLVAPARRLAKLLGSSADRVAHSAVRVSNAVTHATARGFKKPGPVLVLLPRCVQRPECSQPLVEDVDSCRRCGECPVEGILALREEYDDVVMAVLTGGSVVPSVVRHFDPRAVIGVACERELITGIYVVNDRPVLGVANQRPEGPCRRTALDVAELRAAVETFATGAADVEKLNRE
jgi:hypothetical protein